MLGAYSEEKGLYVEFSDFSWDIKPEQIFSDIKIENGHLIKNGQPIQTEGLRIEASFQPSAAQLSDDAQAGVVQGRIISFLYVGDHYRYTVRSKSEEDYVVDDEYLWNQEDYVSILIPKEKVSYRILNGKNKIVK